MTAYLDRAVEIARTQRPHPNPRVGAVVVDPHGAVVGEGSHEGPGLPHAEVNALAAAGMAARGSTVYVTLEPCNHDGRTGPCVEALLEAGIAEVVIGALDPNPDVRGGGAAALRESGVDVRLVEEPDERADPGYFHAHRTGLPLVTLKAAMTLDGATAALDGTSQWITNQSSRRDAHRLRSRSDAVVVGAGTVIADDPALTVRLDGFTGPQPVPIVIKGTRPLPSDAQVLDRAIVFEPAPDGRVDLEAMLRDLAKRGLFDVLVEGGSTLAGSIWQAGLVDRGVFYLAGKIAGGAGRPALDRAFETLSDAADVRIVDLALLDGDVRLEFDVHRNH